LGTNDVITIDNSGRLLVDAGSGLGGDDTHFSLRDSGISHGISSAGAVTAMAALAKGTLVVGDGSTDPTTQAVGTNDHVLTADSAQGSGVLQGR